MVETFRMDKSTFNYICEKLSPALAPHPSAVRPSIPINMQVAIAIYKLASCAEYRVVGNQFGVQKSTVHKYLYNFSWAMVTILLREEIRLPNEIEAYSIISGFEQKSGIPQILRVIDATLTMPKKEVADRDVGAFFIGDSAYPLLTWLLKGYSGILTAQQDSFNAYFNKARRVVENAFSRLNGRWRILQKRIDIDVNFVPHIVATCCILPNILERRKSLYREGWNESPETSPGTLVQPSSTYEVSTFEAERIRKHVKQYLTENFPMIEIIRHNRH